uniref:RING-type domain-containing protein n=1 Tax=viral metagenome TaxID=1070528 RepID=A0A6C0HQY0_9ZZZZ
MFRATVKIAYGIFTTSVVLERNLSTSQIIDSLKTLVKNSFNVEEDAVIQIVESSSKEYCELEEELTGDSVLSNFNDAFFYARIVRKFNNIEYIKTDTYYLKKEELEMVRSGELNQARQFLESELLPRETISTVLTNENQVIPESELLQTETSSADCVLCNENQVIHERMFSCCHLFCHDCLSRWRISAGIYNCPLCRS